METKNSISIKRSIAIKAIVTTTWKEDAEKERLKADNILFDGVVQANKEEIKSIGEVENKYTSLMKKLIELGLVRKASVISGFGGEGVDSELTKMEQFVLDHLNQLCIQYHQQLLLIP